MLGAGKRTATAAVLLVIQAACGGGDDDAGDPDSPDDPTTAAPSVGGFGEWREGTEADQTTWRTEVAVAAHQGRIWSLAGSSIPLETGPRS